MASQVLEEVWREFARQGVAQCGRAVSFDRLPTARRRSRGQHFRNGIGAIIVGGSELAWRRDPVRSFSYAISRPVRSRFAYGLAELRSARPPRTVTWRRSTRLALAMAGVVALRIAMKSMSPDDDDDETAWTYHGDRTVEAPLDERPQKVASAQR
jgi:hypothetical protein